MSAPVPVKVQELGSVSGNTTTVTLALSGLANPTTVGNAVLLSIRTGTGATVTGVTDSLGTHNTWTINKSGSSANSNSCVVSTILTHALGNGDSIIVTVSSAQPNTIVQGAEFKNVAQSATGVAQVDASTAVNAHASANTITEVTTTAAAKQDLVFSAMACTHGSTTGVVATSDPSSSGTWSQLTSSNDGCGAAYEVGPNSVTQFSVTWNTTGTVTNIDASTVAFSAGLGILTAASNVPGGSVGTVYSKGFSAQGGIGSGRTWSITSGPPGLSFTGSTLGGTPTTTGTYNSTITVTDTGGNSASLAVTITIAATGFSITTGATLTSGTKGTAYGPVAFATTGGTGTVKWSLLSGVMPPGLNLSGSTSTSQLFGSTFATGAKTNTPAWSSAVSAIQWCKLYYTPSDGFPAPASLSQANNDVQEAVANGTKVFLCYHLTAWGSTVDSSWQGDTTANKPSASVISNEQTALITSIQAHLNLGLNIKAVVLNQELDGAKVYIPGQPKFTLTGPQATYPYYKDYKALKKAFPNIDVAICYVNFSVDTPTSRAAYFPGPTQTNPAGWGPKTNGVGLCYTDGIIVDAYADVTVNSAARHMYSATPTTAPGWADIADYNGINFGWGEAGNSATGNPSDQAHMTLYLSAETYQGNPGSSDSIEGVFRYRVANNLPLNYPAMWYENGSSSAPGFNNIDISSGTTDYRIGMLQGIAATLASHVGGQISGIPQVNGTYNFTLQATDSTGATTSKAFSLTIGTGSNTLAFTNSATLPTATVGVEDFFQWRVTGGTSPYTFSKTAGSFPAGESLTDTVNGVMDGTPTTAGNNSFTIKVTDSATPTPNTATQACTQQVAPLTVTGAPYFMGGTNAPSGGSNLTLTVPLVTGSNQGDFIQVAVMATTAQTISVSDTAGNTYTLAESDTTETGAQLYIFECDGAAPLTPVPDPISGNPDNIAVTYSDNTSAQFAIAVGDNGTTARDKLIIAHGSSTAPSSGSTGTLGSTEEHAIAFIADAFPGGNPTWASPFSSNVLDSESVSSVGRLTAAAVTVSANTALTASATITSAPWTAALTTFEALVPTITGLLSDGVAGDPYSQTLGISGGVAPFTSSVTSGALPPGLTLASNVVSGTPTSSGSFTFTIQVTDTNGVSASTTQTIVIAPSAVNGVPGITLAGNILTPADCDFESGVGSWVSASNATGIATSSNAAVTGLSSLMWQATANGSTSVQTATYTGIQGGAPYVVSGYLFSTSNQGPNLWIGVNWYDSGGTFISSASNNGAPLDSPLGWQPVQTALTAPDNAAQAKVFAIVDLANAGDVSYLDTVYFAKAGVQILADWTNPPFETAGTLAGQDFMDLTPFVRLDQGINYTRGRQDMISDVPPGSASFYLQNDTGIFSVSRNESLPSALGGAITLQARCQINVADDDGNWWTRFDGQVSEIDYTFDATGNTSLAQINLTDILGYLNRSPGLWCWTKQQILEDGPLYHWTLDDAGKAGGPGVAVESSGNNGPAMRLANSDTSNTATITFQSGNGGVETLADATLAGHKDGSEFWTAGSNIPSSQIRGLDSGTVGPYSSPLSTVYLTPKLNAQSAQNQFVGNVGYQLQAELPTPITPGATGANYSIECWFTMDPGIATDVLSDFGPYTILSLGTAREGTCLIAAVYPTATSTLKLHVQTFSQPPGFLGKNYPGTAPPSTVQDMSTTMSTGAGTNGMDNVQIPHHLVINLTGDPLSPVVTAWLDGSPVAFPGFSLPKSQYYNTICVGGAFGGTGCHWGGLALVSIYNTQLTSQQIADHCMLGQYGAWEQPTDDVISRLAGYANIPPFWNNTQAQHSGLALTDYQDITGSSPLTAMQTYEQTEQGFIFVDHNGALNFHTRDWRMGYQGPDLILPPDTYTPDLGYQVVDQFMQNESAIGTQTYPTGAAYTNAASQALYGPYVTNSPQSPTQIPLFTFNRAAGMLGLPSFGFNADPNLSDTAAWQANTFSVPFALPNSLTIDLLTLDSTSGMTVAEVYALEIDNVIAPDVTKPLPESFPDADLSLEWFIEGISETITNTQHTIQFYTSPAEPQRAWIPGDPVYGVLGDTARVGISAADVSPVQADGKDVSHDAGEPFWPPTFAAGMNNLNGSGKGFVGSLDMRGLIDPLSRMLNPPMCIVSAVNQTQTVNSGSIGTPQVFWDTVHVDTEGSMGLVPGWPNWYVCTVPGYYDIDGCVMWSTASGSNAGSMGQGWVIVAKQAAQLVAAGTGDPDHATQYVFPVGESPRWNGVGVNAVNCPTTQVYLGLGDMVTIGAQQNTGVSLATGTAMNGSHMSILFRGFATNDDGDQFNTSISTGGTVSDKPTVTQFIKTYSNTHTFSYDGAFDNYANRVTGTPVVVYQGQKPGGTKNDSQSGQITFPFNTIQSDLNPGTGTVTLKSCSITGTNIFAGVSTGCYAAFGWSNATAGQSHFNAGTVTNNNVKYQKFQQGQTVTAPLPLSFATAFQTGNAKMVILGDSQTTRAANYGKYQGGPGSWLLTIEYTVTV